MYCKYCGKNIPKNSKFCKYCGERLDSISLGPKLNQDSIISSKKTNIVSSVSRTTLNLIVMMLIAVNFFSGIVGGIWLAVTGGLSLVFFGLLLSIVMPWGYTIAFLPQMGLAVLLSKPLEKGNRALVTIIGFLASSYGNLILAIWTVFVFNRLVIEPNLSLVPLLLWGYSTVMAPLSYMASKEPPDSAGTSMGLLFAQLGYALLTILLLTNNYGSFRNIGLGILILLFSSVSISAVVGSMQSKAAQSIV